MAFVTQEMNEGEKFTITTLFDFFTRLRMESGTLRG